MIVVVDPRSPIPPYEQVRRGLADAIASGELMVGARLPTVRHLAANLGLAPNTVARAYRELEGSGTVTTRGRRGTFVAGPPGAGPDAEEAAAGYARRIRELGVDPDEALRLVRVALSRGEGPAA